MITGEHNENTHTVQPHHHTRTPAMPIRQRTCAAPETAQPTLQSLLALIANQKCFTDGTNLANSKTH